MAAESYFMNFVSSRKDVEAEFAEHLGKSTREQIRAGLLVDDVRVFEDCIGSVRQLLGGHELGLLAGGPPCQGFSMAGRRSPDDPRNHLVWSFIKFTELLSPLVVLMENVDAIQHAYEQANRASMLSDLEDALQGASARHGGYAIARLSLRADHYGVPQRRKRMFLIGVRKDVACNAAVSDRYQWDSGKGSSKGHYNPLVPVVTSAVVPTASEAIWDLVRSQYAPFDSAPSQRARDYALNARGGDAKQVKVAESSNGESPPNHEFRSHRASTRTRFRLLRLLREQGLTNQVFALAAAGQPGIEPQLAGLEPLLPIEFPTCTVETLGQLASLVRSLPSLKRSQRALDRDAPSPTITTLPDDLCHYEADRTLTVREMARLQSFPDTFVFRGNCTTGGDRRRVQVPQYSQVANAVPPKLATALGMQLRNLVTQ